MIDGLLDPAICAHSCPFVAREERFKDGSREVSKQQFDAGSVSFVLPVLPMLAADCAGVTPGFRVPGEWRLSMPLQYPDLLTEAQIDNLIAFLLTR